MSSLISYNSTLLTKRIHLLFITVALILGGLIYVLFRTHDPRFFIFFSEFGLADLLNAMRRNTLPISTTLPQWVVFSLPNGLWAFAYSLFISGIWSGSKAKIRYFWLTTIPVLVLGFETLQYTETIQGTFSIQDIIFGVLGISIGVLMENKITKTKNYEKITA